MPLTASHATTTYRSVDAGHFALDEATDAIAGYVRDFLGRKLTQ
jgi:hypothetical protein